jgi:hypothetical protein
MKKRKKGITLSGALLRILITSPEARTYSPLETLFSVPKEMGGSLPFFAASPQHYLLSYIFVMAFCSTLIISDSSCGFSSSKVSAKDRRRFHLFHLLTAPSPPTTPRQEPFSGLLTVIGKLPGDDMLSVYHAYFVVPYPCL